jgi:hypothetical protein
VGKLVYGFGNLEVDIEDRVLAHIQLVVVAKLRRNEGFMLTWTDEAAVGDGRSSIWLHQSIPLYFKYDDNAQPSINRQWLELLTVTATSAAGLRIVEEPAE